MKIDKDQVLKLIREYRINCERIVVTCESTASAQSYAIGVLDSLKEDVEGLKTEE